MYGNIAITDYSHVSNTKMTAITTFFTLYANGNGLIMIELTNG